MDQHDEEWKFRHRALAKIGSWHGVFGVRQGRDRRIARKNLQRLRGQRNAACRCRRRRDRMVLNGRFQMVTARHLIEEARRHGARFEVVGDGRLRATPRNSIPADLGEAIGAHKDAIIAELLAADVRQLIARAEVSGLRLSIDGTEGLRVRHETIAEPPRDLLLELSAHKASVIAELNRGHLVPDAACAGMFESEWRIAGCQSFTVVATADDALERRYGACIACGCSWAMHDSPDPTSWQRVTDADAVKPAAVRYVLARAQQIVSGT